MTDEGEEVKTCTQCGRTLPLSAFRPKAFYKVGRMSWCAECVDTYKRRRYATDPEYRERIKQERRERYKREGR